VRKIKRETLYYVAWIQTVIATAGSLYFSEVMGFEPCKLCWLQRIFMYPLVIILYIGIRNKDKNLAKYVLPLAGIGWLISAYHNFLYYQSTNTNSLFCVLGAPCTEKYISWLGFVSIPLLALIAFSVIIVAMVMVIKGKEK
jgi:disulfide bond formation protein DsbB